MNPSFKRRKNAEDVAQRCQVRRSKREAIQEFFLAHLGERFDTAYLHARFGSSFRTRASELNRDTGCPVRILNGTSASVDDSGRPCERSNYWAELRRSDHQPLSSFMQRRQAEESSDRAEAMPLFAGVDRE